jgi:hypothetical protein
VLSKFFAFNFMPPLSLQSSFEWRAGFSVSNFAFGSASVAYEAVFVVIIAEFRGSRS